MPAPAARVNKSESQVHNVEVDKDDIYTPGGYMETGMKLISYMMGTSTTDKKTMGKEHTFTAMKEDSALTIGDTLQYSRSGSISYAPPDTKWDHTLRGRRKPHMATYPLNPD